MNDGGLDLARDLYAFHAWANRRLWDAFVALGPRGTANLGKHFSFPTIKAMFAHILGADVIWLERWKGAAPSRLLGDSDFPTTAALRERWDELEKGQRAFIAALVPTHLRRVVAYRNTAGQPFTAPLGILLHHVVNHGTHHRSEIATMITTISGPPPDTGIVTYHLLTSGQMA